MPGALDSSCAAVTDGKSTVRSANHWDTGIVQLCCKGIKRRCRMIEDSAPGPRETSRGNSRGKSRREEERSIGDSQWAAWLRGLWTCYRRASCLAGTFRSRLPDCWGVRL